MFEALEERALFSTQAPFTGSPIAIPGTIQAENYDNGGDGVSYHDTTAGNTGGKYRTGDNVDIISSGTGYAVGYIQAGEWLEYTINITTAGTYRIDASVAAGSSGGGTFHVSVDGTDKTGALTFKDTGGWNTYTTVSKSGVSLAGGTHVLRISFDSAAKTGQDLGNFDYLKLTNSTSSTGGGSFTPKSLHWQSRATNPLNREEAESLVYNGRLIEFGGYNDNFDAQKRVDAYDPKTNKWTRLHDLPAMRSRTQRSRPIRMDMISGSSADLKAISAAGITTARTAKITAHPVSPPSINTTQRPTHGAKAHRFRRPAPPAGRGSSTANSISSAAPTGRAPMTRSRPMCWI